MIVDVSLRRVLSAQSLVFFPYLGKLGPIRVKRKSIPACDSVGSTAGKFLYFMGGTKGISADLKQAKDRIKTQLHKKKLHRIL